MPTQHRGKTQCLLRRKKNCVSDKLTEDELYALLAALLDQTHDLHERLRRLEERVMRYGPVQ